MSAIDPLVIHILEPDRIQSEPSRLARVFMLDGALPWSGSVRPKQPTACPAAIRGSHSFFWSSEPYFQIRNIANDAWTHPRLPRPEAAAPLSRQGPPLRHR